MQKLNREIFPKPKYPTRIVQFGEGNFLRGFVDWMVQRMNDTIDYEAGVKVVQPIPKGLVHLLNEQEGLYTVRMNGIMDGKAYYDEDLVSCITQGIDPYEDFNVFIELSHSAELQIVVSNTTEAGIAYDPSDRPDDKPPASFPGKLTVFLYERFRYFSGSAESGLTIIPCELIDRNGDNLKRLVLKLADDWELPEDFGTWLNSNCTFCNTLVDRIVTGFPWGREEEIYSSIGYEDKLFVETETFHLWVIEGPENVSRVFPAPDAGLNVIFTDDMEPYRTRKVRILNGAHTSMVPVGYLAGLRTVEECVTHPVFGRFVTGFIDREVIPTLELPAKELRDYAKSTINRFENPSIKHFLISIALNSISKYKTRVMPTLLAYAENHGTLPPRSAFALACLLRMYRGDLGEDSIDLNDDADSLEFIRQNWSKVAIGDISISQLTQNLLGNEDFWGRDLNLIDGLSITVSSHLEKLAISDPSNVIFEFIKKTES